LCETDIVSLKYIAIRKGGFIGTLTANNVLTTITGVTVLLYNKENNGHEGGCEAFTIKKEKLRTMNIVSFR
jgi:hypothetical protein